MTSDAAPCDNCHMADKTFCRRCGSKKPETKSWYCASCNSEKGREWYAKQPKGRLRTKCCRCHAYMEPTTSSYCFKCQRDRPRKCPKCGEVYTGTSRGAYCGPCMRTYARERRRNNPDVRERARQLWIALRLEAIKRYGGACECCGETRYEFLSIDHINGGGTRHRAEIGTRITLWLRKAGYPPGFRVLCHSCNQSLGIYGYCPHRSPSQLEQFRPVTLRHKSHINRPHAPELPPEMVKDLPPENEH
jgi:hypothetical protein